jgi:lipopolysaccharide transport system ATP-binding protein
VIKTKGRIASLLEVGTGFHPELTGLENIYLNGTILGMTKAEIKLKEEQIIDFSGCTKYIDTPVKRYSSGMRVRLAFAVAAFLEPDILVVDEVLAVGDAEFQKKAIGKMQDISKGQGRTVLFVSHNMAAVKSLCTGCLVLQNGNITYIGKTDGAIQKYLNIGANKIGPEWNRAKSSKELNIEAIKSSLIGSQPRLKLKVDVLVYGGKQEKTKFMFAMNISNDMDVMIGQTIPSFDLVSLKKESRRNYSFLIDINGFVPDTYYLSVWIGPHFSNTLDWVKKAVSFEVIESPQFGRTFPHTRENGPLIIDSLMK